MGDNFVTFFETREDRVEIEEGAPFVGEEVFLLASCLAGNWHAHYKQGGT